MEEITRLNFPSQFSGGNKLRIDLHVHSTGSDGTNSPEELINMAVDKKNTSFFSITDHDTLDGIKDINFF